MSTNLGDRDGDDGGGGDDGGNSGDTGRSIGGGGQNGCKTSGRSSCLISKWAKIIVFPHLLCEHLII